MKTSRRALNSKNEGEKRIGITQQWLSEKGDPTIAKLVERNLAIANKISQILNDKGLRPVDLARLMDKQKSEISKWLTGQHSFSIKTITSIEVALGKDILHVEPIQRNVYFTTYVRIPSDKKYETREFKESTYEKASHAVKSA